MLNKFLMCSIVIVFTFFVGCSTAKKKKAAATETPITDFSGGVGPLGASGQPKFGNGAPGQFMQMRSPAEWQALNNSIVRSIGQTELIGILEGSGDGTPALIDVKPTTIDFYAQATKSPPLVLAFIATNSGGASVIPKIQKEPKAPFFLVAHGCPEKFMCQTSIAFVPEEPKDYEDTLEVNFSNPAGYSQTFSIKLVGKGYDKKIVSVAGEGGGPHIKVFNVRSGEERSFFAPGLDPATYRGGFGGVAMGDVTGDYIPDILVGSGTGVPSKVYVYEGRSETLLTTVSNIFEPSFMGGVRVATGDFNGDLKGDWAAAAGPGGAARIKVFDQGTDKVMADLIAFEPSLKTGANIAAGDINGDGKKDLIVGPGIGGGPRLQVYDVISKALIYDDFVEQDSRFRQGLEVSALYANDDFNEDIVVSPGPGVVKVLDGRNGQILKNYSETNSIFSAPRLACFDLNGDLRSDLIMTAGPDDPSKMVAVDSENMQQLKSVAVFDKALKGGTYGSGR